MNSEGIFFKFGPGPKQVVEIQALAFVEGGPLKSVFFFGMEFTGMVEF